MTDSEKLTQRQTEADHPATVLATRHVGVITLAVHREKTAVVVAEEDSVVMAVAVVVVGRLWPLALEAAIAGSLHAGDRQKGIDCGTYFLAAGFSI